MKLEIALVYVYIRLNVYIVKHFIPHYTYLKTIPATICFKRMIALVWNLTYNKWRYLWSKFGTNFFIPFNKTFHHQRHRNRTLVWQLLDIVLNSKMYQGILGYPICNFPTWNFSLCFKSICTFIGNILLLYWKRYERHCPWDSNVLDKTRVIKD